MDTLNIFSLFLLLSISMSIKIPIIDEDYIDVVIGTPPTKFKLLIDPVAPFSYINKKFDSVTYETKLSKKSFSNIFGNYDGEWATDFFYLTTDKYFPLRMEFVMVNKTDSAFNVDGVIGLGYSENLYQNCSIYANLAKLNHIFPTKNVFSYDKKKRLLTIGELPERDNFNPVTFPIKEGQEKDYPASFVNITSILMKNKNGNSTFLNITGHAKLGLMPVIIAPNHLGSVISQYNTDIKAVNGTYTLEPDEKKFYSTYRTTEKNKNITTEMIFDKIAYKYDHVLTDAKQNMISNIRLGLNTNLKFWYIGIDNLNVHRADFDFSKGEVTLFSPTAYDIFSSKTYILFSFVLFGIAISIIIGVIIRTQCQKKRKSEMAKEEGQELI